MAQDAELQPVERLTDLGHLSSAVGHHVINAFSAVVSNAEILRLTANSDLKIDPLTVAEQIIRSAVEASGVARRLIDFTRPITHVGDQPIALDQLVREVVEEERTQHPPEIIWEIRAGRVPTIQGHGPRLREMLRLLLDNARDSLPPSGGTIVVSTSVDDRGWVMIEVTDNGSGMPPEVLARAVEPFFTTRSGHSGVGLSIANGIWRRHKGTLSLRSRPDVGTSVRLCVEPSRDPLPSAGRGG